MAATQANGRPTPRPKTVRDRPGMKLFYGRLFYGWVIVGAGIVITCLGMGTMMSLGIFLQPMSAATGWSRTSISTAALLNFLCMGPASFLWGALSDRFGTRAVVLAGGALLGVGLVAASQAGTVGQFQESLRVDLEAELSFLFAAHAQTAEHFSCDHENQVVFPLDLGADAGPFAHAELHRHDE